MREGRSGTLAARLALAFLVVAVVAVGVLASLVIFATDSQITALVDQQHRENAEAAALTAATAYRASGGWDGADLLAAGSVAASADASLVVLDADGAEVARPTDELAEMMERMHGVVTPPSGRGRPVLHDVVVDDQVVGRVELRFPTAHDAPADEVRTALWRTSIVGAALAAAVAMATAVFVAIRLTRPLDAITAAAARQAAGDRSARAGVSGAGELGMLATTFDEMAGRLETEDQLRRQMVSDLAHELRTPLTILQAETEALRDGVAPATPEAFTSLNDEAARLTRLVSDLEALAAADAAGLTMVLQPVDLADIASRAVAAVRSAADDARVVVDERLAPAPAMGDPDRLHQVALNLLSNAIKFTPAEGTVSVRTRLVEGTPTLTVADTGPGIAPEERPHLFDRFWQGAAGRAAGTGAGVGLAVATGIVAAHHGTLALQDQDGPGATFVLRLEPPAPGGAGAGDGPRPA